MSSAYLNKQVTKKRAKVRAYSAFSLYLRTLWTQKGYVECYTCGKHLTLKGKSGDRVMAGHWVEGHRNATYINEAYVRPQCFVCNIMMGGNQGEFRDRVRKELGDEIVDKLLIEARQEKDISAKDYLQMESYYKELLKQLLKE